MEENSGEGFGKGKESGEGFGKEKRVERTGERKVGEKKRVERRGGGSRQSSGE